MPGTWSNTRYFLLLKSIHSTWGSINTVPSESVVKWCTECALGVGIRRYSIEYNAGNFVWSPSNVYSPPKWWLLHRILLKGAVQFLIFWGSVCVFVCLPFCVFRIALVFYIWQAVGGRELCVFGLGIRKTRVPWGRRRQAFYYRAFFVCFCLWWLISSGKTKVTAQLQAFCNPSLSHQTNGVSITEGRQGGWGHGFVLTREADDLRTGQIYRWWNWKGNIWGPGIWGPYVRIFHKHYAGESWDSNKWEIKNAWKGGRHIF